jgi:hypothetical protein
VGGGVGHHGDLQVAPPEKPAKEDTAEGIEQDGKE